MLVIFIDCMLVRGGEEMRVCVCEWGHFHGCRPSFPYLVYIYCVPTCCLFLFHILPCLVCCFGILMPHVIIALHCPTPISLFQCLFHTDNKNLILSLASQREKQRLTQSVHTVPGDSYFDGLQKASCVLSC